MLADVCQGAWSYVGRKLTLFHPCPAGRLVPGSALVLSAAKLPQEAHVTGKVTFGRTRSIPGGPSQSPFTETEVRLDGTAWGGSSAGRTRSSRACWSIRSRSKANRARL